MATALGVSLSTVNNWEVERSKPSRLAQEKLKRLFVEEFRHLDEPPLEEDQDLRASPSDKEGGDAFIPMKIKKEIQLPLSFENYLKPRYSINSKA